MSMHRIYDLFVQDENTVALFSLIALSSVPTRLSVGAAVVFILSPVARKVENLHIHSFKGNPKCHKLERLLSIKFS